MWVPCGIGAAARVVRVGHDVAGEDARNLGTGVLEESVTVACWFLMSKKKTEEREKEEEGKKKKKSTR